MNLFRSCGTITLYEVYYERKQDYYRFAGGGICYDVLQKAAESFRIISPGDIVSLNNAEIADFIDDYYFGKSLEYIDKSKGDRYFPNSVGIKWNGVCGDYELTVSLSEDFSNAVTYNGEGFGAPIDGLFTGKTYFCKVKSSKDGKESEVKRFATERGPRTVK